MLGCLVYLESTRTFRWYPKVGVFDECNLDKSGRWTISLEDLGVPNDIAMRIFDNQSGKETRVNGPYGTLGHLDTGYGYAVGADNYNSLPNASILWLFNPSIVQGPVVQYNVNWNIAAVNHIPMVVTLSIGALLWLKIDPAHQVFETKESLAA